jgi:hypothetical protein
VFVVTAARVLKPEAERAEPEPEFKKKQVMGAHA